MGIPCLDNSTYKYIICCIQNHSTVHLPSDKTNQFDGNKWTKSSRMKNIVLIVLTFTHLLHLLLVSANKPKISLKLTTKPVILGQDIILTCVGTTCVHKNAKYWMGGPADTEPSTLAVNGTSTSEKYTMPNANSDDRSISLIVRNVTLADLSYQYRCTCGMNFLESYINISYSEIVALPSKDMTKYRIEEWDDVLYLNFTLHNVSSTPNCTTVFQDQHIEIDVADEISTKDIMKDINYRKRFVISKEGSHRLKVECRSAGHDVVVIDELVECKMEQGFSSFPFVIGGCTGILILLIIGALAIGCVKRAKYRTVLKARNDIPFAGTLSEETYIPRPIHNYGYKSDTQSSKQLLPS